MKNDMDHTGKFLSIFVNFYLFRNPIFIIVLIFYFYPFIILRVVFPFSMFSMNRFLFQHMNGIDGILWVRKSMKNHENQWKILQLYNK